MKAIKHKATLHDGSVIGVEVYGSGPAVLLPVNVKPAEGSDAEIKQKWGMDPALGQSLVEGLSDQFTVVAFDYEGHLIKHPAPDTLTPENIARDILAVADSAGVDRFAYYGYSWLAVCGLQLAIRTDRLWALIMGGYPPVDGPYEGMLTVTKATHDMAVQAKSKPHAAPKTKADSDEFDWDSVEVTMTEVQTRQFMTLYGALKGFDDRAAQAKITCPRLCFTGSADKIEYGERWENAVVDIAGPFIKQSDEMKRFGWDVKVLEGLDHTQAMQPQVVLPIIRPWLTAKADTTASNGVA
jgi:pimeloyl-ACP methyl ester carboxylesterase